MLNRDQQKKVDKFSPKFISPLTPKLGGTSEIHYPQTRKNWLELDPALLFIRPNTNGYEIGHR